MPKMKERGKTGNGSFIQFSREKLRLCKPSSELERFLNITSANQQLDFIKRMGTKLKDQTGEDKHDSIQIAINIFLEVPLKHPLKNATKKLLYSQKTTVNNLDSLIISQLFEMVSSATFDDGDGDGINDLCNAITSCFEVFSNETFNDEHVLSTILIFLKEALRMNTNYLKLFTNNFSPAKKMNIYSHIHNIIRLTIVVLQKYNVLNNLASYEPLWEEIGSLCSLLISHTDIPMDTKINSCIVLIFVLRLLSGSNSWIELLELLFSNRNSTDIAILKNFTDFKDCATLKLGICTAIINVISVDQLYSVKIKDLSALNFISNNLIILSEISSVNTAVILGITRGFLVISKILFDASSIIYTDVADDILNFVWSYLDHYVDSIRHLTIQILSNLVKYSSLLDTKGDNRMSNKLINAVLNAQNNQYIYYKSLVTLGSRYKCSHLLQHNPKLVENMISTINNTSDIASVSTAFEILMEKHQLEISDEILFETWVKPILSSLMALESRNQDEYSQTISVMREILTKAVKLSSHIIELTISHILKNESEQLCALSEGHFKCILICLNVVRKIGYFDNFQYPVQSRIKLWKNILPFDLLNTATFHTNSEISILAFSLVVDSHKTTELFIQPEFDIIEKFIYYNINNNAPNIRQEISSVIRKFLDRWINSYMKMIKNPSEVTAIYKSDNLSQDTSKCCLFEEALASYETFLSNLCSMCLENIFPDANFNRRNLSMQIILWCQDLFDKCESLARKLQINSWQPAHIKMIYNYLEDSYEINKQLAVKILCFPDQFKELFPTDIDKHNCIEEAIVKASSIRPTDCVTSAYKLELTLKRSHESPFSDHYSTICKLLHNLCLETKIASENILVASGNGPMYGLIYCIRHILGKVDFKVALKDLKCPWKVLISDIITICFEINKVVCPIVNNSSPEGHLPVDFNKGSLYVERSGVQLENGKCVTAQMVLLCGWRSVKEVSLLLGDLSYRAGIMNENDLEDQNDGGIVTKQHLLDIGDHFITLLSETKHRGAFEQAYVGFSKLCQRLWKCNASELHNLPHTWLNDLISAIASGDSQNSKLCATRRSAGVPFIVQALVITELQVNNSPQSFEKCMNTLLQLAKPESGTSVETRTHCLNILRALYRHTVLGEYVNPFVADGLMISINGFEGATWTERNSCTLLFSSLMTRVFGVQRTKDSEQLCIRNKMTGRIFFLRYPELYDYFLNFLKAFDINDKKNIMKPSLYPVLLLLSRLYPSSLEGTDSNLKLVAFIPSLTLCSGSCVLKIRQLVAKAVMPLISAEQYLTYIISLLQLASNSKGKTNFCHGILLQLVKLLQNVPDNINAELRTLQSFISCIKECRWMLINIFEDISPCFAITELYIEIMLLLLYNFPSIIELDEPFFFEINDKISIIIQTEKTWTISLWKEQCLIQAVHLGLYLSAAFMLNSKDAVTQFLIGNLKHSSYEVVSTLLNYIICLHSKKARDLDEQFEIGIAERKFVDGLSDEYVSNILSEMENAPDFKQQILRFRKMNDNFQFHHKIYFILSHMPKVIYDQMFLTTLEINDVLESIINRCNYECEDGNYVYLQCLDEYFQNNACMTVFDHCKIENAYGFSKVLLRNSSMDTNGNNKIAVVNIILNHWKLFNYKLVDEKRFPIIINHFMTIFKLLNDEDKRISKKISKLTNSILSSEDVLGNEIYLKSYLNENKSREILIEIFTNWMHQNGIQYAIAMLIIMSIGEKKSKIDNEHVNESQVFDKKNDTNEEEICMLTLHCMQQMKKLSYFRDFKEYVINSIFNIQGKCLLKQIQSILNSNNILTNICKNIEFYDCDFIFLELQKLIDDKKTEYEFDTVENFKVSTIVKIFQDIINICKQ